MRVALIIVVLWLACAVAYAGNRVVVMTDRDDLVAALHVELGSRHLEVAVEPTSPAGQERLDRAAAAQRVAIANNADAGIWIDTDGEVWVVLGDGRDLRHAPLPVDATPRVFATIAASLVDELFAPPESAAGFGVDVHVEVTPPGATPPISLAPSPAPVAIARPATIVAAAQPDEIVPIRAKNALLEIGPTVTNASYGIEAELLWPVSSSLKLGPTFGLNMLFEGYNAVGVPGTTLLDAGVELRHVGTGVTHFDFSGGGGITHSSSIDDTEGFLAMRFGVAHEYRTSAISFGIAPMMLFGSVLGETLTLMASLHLALPL